MTRRRITDIALSSPSERDAKGLFFYVAAMALLFTFGLIVISVGG